MFSACASQPDAGDSEETSGRSAGAEEIRLYVELETTAEATDIWFPEDHEILTGMFTAYSPGVEAFIEPDRFGMVQGKEAAEKGEQARGEALLRVRAEVPEEFKFVINTEGPGETRLTFFRMDTGLLQPMGSFETEPESENCFTVNMFLEEIFPPDFDDLPYPDEKLAEMLNDWQRAVKEYAFPGSTLFWPEADHIFIVPWEEYFVRNAVQVYREDEAVGPNPDIDYSLLNFSGYGRFPGLYEGRAKYLTIATFDGVPSAADLFYFEERQGEWKFIRQIFKMGVELP